MRELFGTIFFILGIVVLLGVFENMEGGKGLKRSLCEIWNGKNAVECHSAGYRPKPEDQQYRHE